MLPFIRPQALLFRIIGALLLCSLAACSTLQFGYRHADALSYWWLDSYLDLTQAQSLQVRTELTALHTWHRSQELPAYIDLVRQMQGLAGSSQVSPQQVCALVPALRARLQRLGEQAAIGAAALAPTLQAEQLRHLAQQFDKRNRKWREDWLDVSTSELGEHRFNRARERAELLFGRLTESQHDILRQELLASRFDPRLGYGEILRRQQDILQTLGKHGGPSSVPNRFKADMLALVERSLASPDPQYRNYQERLTAESCQTLADLHRSASPAQRAHAIALLKGYEADLRELSMAPP